MSESAAGAPYTPGEKLLGGSPKVKAKAATPRKRTAAAKVAADVVEVDVIRWPDTRDPEFMERMRTARRERGLVGLIEALREECALRPGEVPRGWVNRAVAASRDDADDAGGEDESDGMAR